MPLGEDGALCEAEVGAAAKAPERDEERRRKKKLTFFSLEKQNVFQDLWRSRALAAEDALATLM